MFVQSAPTYLHWVILEELETHEDQVDQELLRIFPHVLAEVAKKDRVKKDCSYIYFSFSYLLTFLFVFPFDAQRGF